MTLKQAREIAARVWCDPAMESYCMDGTAADIIARILILSCHEEERVRGEIPADVSQDFGSFPIKTALDGDVRI